MKKYRLFLFLILFLSIFVSCSKSVIFEEKVTFPDANWAFENKAVTFKVPITGSEKPYAIVLELELIGMQNVDKINSTFSILTPLGAETVKPVVFNFKSPQEPYIKGNTENSKIYRLTAYPKKYFSETGTYTIIVDQYSNKADNYGIQSLQLRIEKTKE